MITQGLLASFTSLATPITGLIAYWKFANGADTTEYTGTYNLTKTGAPTIGTDRLSNTAGFSAFSTTKYFSHASFLDAGLTAWTFFGWFKATGTTRQFMVDKLGTTGPTYPFELVTDTNGKLSLYNSTTTGINIFQSTNTVNSGSWVFAVVSGDSSGRASISMNINGGSAEGSLTSSTGADSGSIGASTAYDFRIGGRGDDTEAYTNGSIGECGFCNRVLTAAEKLRLYTDSSAQYIVPGILIP